MTTFMLFVMVLIIIALLVFIKFKVSASKPANERTAVEKIISSVGVVGRENLEKTAEKMRTTEISQKEGIQQCKDAQRRLENEYQSELASTIKRRDDLLESLPTLRATPGNYETKARDNKKKMEEALGKGETELASQYKENAIMYLDMKKKALVRLEKTEKFVKDINVTIEKSKIQYERRKAKLDDLLAEFQAMHGPISSVKFNDSVKIIESLRQETTEKLRAQNAEFEASEIVNGTKEEPVVSSDYDKEFEEL